MQNVGGKGGKVGWAVSKARAKAAAVNQKLQQQQHQLRKTAENSKLGLAGTRTHLIKVKALVFLYFPFYLSTHIFLCSYFAVFLLKIVKKKMKEL